MNVEFEHQGLLSRSGRSGRRWIGTCIAAMLLLPGVAPVQAAWTASRPITFLKMQANGLHMRLDGFANSDSSITCSSNDFFLPKDDPAFKERVVFLLTAQASGRRVNLSYYECSGAHIKIGSVLLE